MKVLMDLQLYDLILHLIAQVNSLGLQGKVVSGLYFDQCKAIDGSLSAFTTVVKDDEEKPLICPHYQMRMCEACCMLDESRSNARNCC